MFSQLQSSIWNLNVNLLWKFFCEVVKVNILLGWLQPNSFRAWNRREHHKHCIQAYGGKCPGRIFWLKFVTVLMQPLKLRKKWSISTTLKNTNHILTFHVPQTLVKDYSTVDFCYILKLVFGKKIEGQAAFCIYRNSTLELEPCTWHC